MRFDLETTYLAIDGRGEVIPMPVTDTFWQTIDASPAATRSMLAVYPMTADWVSWERHPEGEEVLVLLEGHIEMLMDDGNRQTVAEMRAGTTLVVPAGVWHRALVRMPGRLLGLTYGPGTDHRPA